MIDIPAETDPEALERFTAELARSVARGDREPRPYDPAFCRRCAARPYCPRVSHAPRPLPEPAREQEPHLLLFP